MGYQPQTTTDIQANLTEQLAWQFAERDDQAVAQALASGAGVDAVHTLDEAGLLDGFFAFLQESGVLSHWQSFEIEAVQRVFLPAISLVLLYGVRLLFRDRIDQWPASVALQQCGGHEPDWLHGLSSDAWLDPPRRTGPPPGE